MEKIVAQIFGLIAIIIFVLSVQKKDKEKVLLMQLFANIFYAGGYILLNALSAAIMNGITVFRCFSFYHYDKKKKEIPSVYLIIFIIFTIVMGIYFFDGLLSLIPTVITLLYIISTYQNDMKVLRKVYLLCGFIWLYYNFRVGAYVGCVGNIGEIVSGFIALKKYHKDGDSRN